MSHYILNDRISILFWFWIRIFGWAICRSIWSKYWTIHTYGGSQVFWPGTVSGFKEIPTFFYLIFQLKNKRCLSTTEISIFIHSGFSLDSRKIFCRYGFCSCKQSYVAGLANTPANRLCNTLRCREINNARRTSIASHDQSSRMVGEN